MFNGSAFKLDWSKFLFYSKEADLVTYKSIFHSFSSALVLFQLGTLGAGNHYAEIQVVDEIYDEFAAKKMGVEFKGQVCVMIHCGSRGLGHQVATGMFCSFVVYSDLEAVHLGRSTD